MDCGYLYIQSVIKIKAKLVFIRPPHLFFRWTGFSPTMTSIWYTRRLVNPVLVNTSPIIIDAKINMTADTMNSVKASLARRIRKSACRTPMGTTSKTHQVPASKNTAMAPLASRVSRKCLPMGSTASGQADAQ